MKFMSCHLLSSELKIFFVRKISFLCKNKSYFIAILLHAKKNTVRPGVPGRHRLAASLRSYDWQVQLQRARLHVWVRPKRPSLTHSLPQLAGHIITWRSTGILAGLQGP